MKNLCYILLVIFMVQAQENQQSFTITVKTQDHFFLFGEKYEEPTVTYRYLIKFGYSLNLVRNLNLNLGLQDIRVNVTDNNFESTDDIIRSEFNLIGLYSDLEFRYGYFMMTLGADYSFFNGNTKKFYKEINNPANINAGLALSIPVNKNIYIEPMYGFALEFKSLIEGTTQFKNQIGLQFNLNL